jgi:putative membrane protein
MMKRTSLSVSAVITGATILFASIGFADQTQPGAPATSAQAPTNAAPAAATPAATPAAQAQDASILSKIHKTNQEEIHAGEMAQSNSQSPAVKQYGQTLVQDHQQADQKVQQLASQLGVTLVDPQPSNAAEKAMDQKHSAEMDQLKSLNGAAFDKKFSQTMAKGHSHVIGDLEKKQAQLPTSDPVRQLIAQLLPTLKQHEQTAKQLSNASKA